MIMYVVLVQTLFELPFLKYTLTVDFGSRLSLGLGISLIGKARLRDILKRGK